MKRLFKKGLLASVTLLLALCLGGCAGEPEESTHEPLDTLTVPAGIAAPEEDSMADDTVTAVLYFPSSGGDRLIPVSREITIPGSLDVYGAVLRALLAGPEEGETGVLWPEGLDEGAALEISGEIAVVDLPACARAASQETLYAVRSAIAATLLEMGGLSYVDVLVGGREEGFDLAGTLPVGVMEAMADLQVSDAYARLEDTRLRGGMFSVLAAVYKPSGDGRLIVPEVRRLTIEGMTDIDYLYTLLEELGRGEMPEPLSYISDMPDIVRLDDGVYRAVSIDFSEGLETALEAEGLSAGTYFAALTDTLLGFIPGLEGIRYSVGGKILDGLPAERMPDGQAVTFEGGLAVRSDFDALLGAPVTIWHRDTQSGEVVSAEIEIPQSRQYALSARFEKLLTDGMGTLPAGIDTQDLLAIGYDGRTIGVNLSENARQRISEMDPEGERCAVYAMVNTFTEPLPRARVAFFFEGQQVQRLAGGLEMRGGFIRNAGAVMPE